MTYDGEKICVQYKLNIVFQARMSFLTLTFDHCFKSESSRDTIFSNIPTTFGKNIRLICPTALKVENGVILPSLLSVPSSATLLSLLD